MRGMVLSAFAVIGLVSGTAWAGDLRCQVTDKSGPQASAKVIMTPGGTTLTTARDGTCVFRGLAAGSYRVTAEKTVGGELRGAVAEDVRVRASGQTDARLQLVQAIHIHEYIPLREQSRWNYTWRRYKWYEPWFDPRASGWLEEGHSMIREAAADSARFAGADVIKIEWTVSGFLVRHAPLYTMYETSGAEGYAIHGRTPQTSVDDSYPTYVPPFRYDPPLLIPDLLPRGQAHRVTTRVRYTDGTPSGRVTRVYTLTKFEPVEVTAGTFDDCACIEWTEEAGDTTMTGVMHLAKGVGIVSMTSTDGHFREDFGLEWYRLPAPSAARTLPRAVTPKPPSSAVSTPGKSSPGK